VTGQATLPARDDAQAVNADLARARPALARSARHTADLLAELPEPGRRSPEQCDAASTAKSAIRALRD